jgi:hypothetical protein
MQDYGESMAAAAIALDAGGPGVDGGGSGRASGRTTGC